MLGSSPHIVDIVAIGPKMESSGQSDRLSQKISALTSALQIATTSANNLVIDSFQRVLAEAGPRQAEVLRRCAIPRWFDPGVLAVLRERADGNERVLELLAGYSFVRPIGDGRYAYQDEVR